MLDMEAFLSHAINRVPPECHVDVVEICGGNARTMQVMIRRHFRGGRNFDIVVGSDLTQPEEVRKLFAYLSEKKPFVTVMSPSCVAPSSSPTVSRYSGSSA